VTLPPCPPILVACPARSGSTLLRRLLDAHPDIACPAETDFAVLMEAFTRTARVLAAPDAAGPDEEAAALLAEARGVVDGLAARYLERAGKTRWCDKSLSNVLHLDALAAAWPSARFLLLHRQLMDFIASALDAQPWGLAEYGFDAFAAQHPADPVNAMTDYWLDCTWRLLAFEQHHPGRCLRLRYEELAARPDRELARIWAFTGVRADPGVIARAFGGRDGAAPGAGAPGRGDNKTWYTDGVHEDSVGRGARVPARRIRSASLSRVNELGRVLGYGPVGPDWGAGGPVPGPGAKPDLAQVRVVRRYAAIWTGSVPLPPGAAGPAVAAVDADVLGSLREGQPNLADLTRTGRLRYYGPPFRSPDAEHELFRRVRSLLAGLGPEDLG
jgi:hypothetical protein